MVLRLGLVLGLEMRLRLGLGSTTATSAAVHGFDGPGFVKTGTVRLISKIFLGRPEQPFRTGLCFTRDVIFFFATRSPRSLDRSP